MRTNTVYAEPYPQEVRAAIYCRLSKDDDLSGPSASIQNQENICQGGFHPKDEIPLTNWKL